MRPPHQKKIVNVAHFATHVRRMIPTAASLAPRGSQVHLRARKSARTSAHNARVPQPARFVQRTASTHPIVMHAPMGRMMIYTVQNARHVIPPVLLVQQLRLVHPAHHSATALSLAHLVLARQATPMLV
jgi:hypothetical protein